MLIKFTYNIIMFKLCSRMNCVHVLSLFITIYIQICMNKSKLIADNLERLLFIAKWQQNTPQVLLDNDCSIRVYQSFVIIFQNYFLLCLNTFSAYYAKNYPGIIGWLLTMAMATLFTSVLSEVS